jgi:hypothetical protein
VLIFVSVETCLSQQKAGNNPGQQQGINIVPVKVHQKFVLENPDISPQWKHDKGVYTAQYINPLNNMGYMIVYDSAGHVLRREKELERQDYPAPINDYFVKEYPGEGYVVWSSVDSAGRLFFYSNHNSRLYQFDKQGQLLSPSKTKPEGYDSVLAPVRK